MSIKLVKKKLRLKTNNWCITSKKLPNGFHSLTQYGNKKFLSFFDLLNNCVIAKYERVLVLYLLLFEGIIQFNILLLSCLISYKIIQLNKLKQAFFLVPSNSGSSSRNRFFPGVPWVAPVIERQAWHWTFSGIDFQFLDYRVKYYHILSKNKLKTYPSRHLSSQPSFWWLYC